MSTTGKSVPLSQRITAFPRVRRPLGLLPLAVTWTILNFQVNTTYTLTTHESTSRLTKLFNESITNRCNAFDYVEKVRTMNFTCDDNLDSSERNEKYSILKFTALVEKTRKCTGSEACRRPRFVCRGRCMNSASAELWLDNGVLNVNTPCSYKDPYDVTGEGKRSVAGFCKPHFRRTRKYCVSYSKNSMTIQKCEKKRQLVTHYSCEKQ